MINRKGFSIIEFLVTMTLLLLVFAAAFDIFVPVARRSKAEGGNVQTQIEGVIGLELLRKDIVHAGAGLPWYLRNTPTDPGTADYNEATQTDRSPFNDAKSPGPDDPPRAIITQNAITTAGRGINSSDYLVVKSQLVANPVTTNGTTYVDNPAAEKWTYVDSAGAIRTWGTTQDDMVTTDRVIVVQPASGKDSMALVRDTATGKFFTTYNASMAAAFRPTGLTASYVFGIDSVVDPRMPFNRADYYISSANVPARCAPGTGVLVKTILRQDNGQMGKELPLLDCVASFQVALGVDNTYGDGKTQKNCITNDFSTVTISGLPALSADFHASDVVRSSLREVRIYILAQEGNFDMDYTMSNTMFSSGTSILVGEAAPTDCDNPASTPSSPLTQSCDCTGTDGTLGASLDMSTLPTSHPGGLWTYRKFRWRIYKMVIKPESIVTIQ